MNGSVLIAMAETKEDVMNLLREDVYNTSGVWDLKQVRMSPVLVSLSCVVDLLNGTLLTSRVLHNSWSRLGFLL